MLISWVRFPFREEIFSPFFSFSKTAGGFIPWFFLSKRSFVAMFGWLLFFWNLSLCADAKSFTYPLPYKGLFSSPGLVTILSYELSSTVLNHPSSPDTRTFFSDPLPFVSCLDFRTSFFHRRDFAPFFPRALTFLSFSKKRRPLDAFLP